MTRTPIVLLALMACAPDASDVRRSAVPETGDDSDDPADDTDTPTDDSGIDDEEDAEELDLTVVLLAPDTCETPCTFAAEIGADVAAVRYEADGWDLGEGSGGDHALTYDFSGLGERLVAAVALDGSGAEVARDEAIVTVTGPEESFEGPCYPGPDEAWTTCLPVVELPSWASGYDYPAPISGQYLEPIAYLDLDAVDASTGLAPNFVLEEIAEAWKGQWGVVQAHAVDRLQGVRDDVGALRVNSGYRNPDYNASVGGASSSRHMYGDAFDLSPTSVGLSTLADRCDAHGAGYVSIYETHVHCDWRNDTLDPWFYGSSLVAGEAPWPEMDAWVEDHGVLVAPAEGFDEGEPLREWAAWDAEGDLLVEETGRTFEPPVEAVQVDVLVGGLVTASWTP